MGSHLRKIRRRATGTRLPTIGKESSWKEDLLSLAHLARCLGFPNDAVSGQVWKSELSGHFTPGIIIKAAGIEYAFTLGDVPGTQHTAAAVWKEFRARVDPASFGDIFLASQIADPTIVERICESLEAVGITIPAKQRAEGTHLAPVGA